MKKLKTLAPVLVAATVLGTTLTCTSPTKSNKSCAADIEQTVPTFAPTPAAEAPAARTLPPLSQEDIFDIDFPPIERNTAPAEISAQIEIALLKLHAQGRQIHDSFAEGRQTPYTQLVVEKEKWLGENLRHYTHAPALLHDLIEKTQFWPDGTDPKSLDLFDARLKALQSVSSNYAMLNPHVDEQTLFNIKVKIMPLLHSVVKAEKMTLGAQTQDSEEIHYRVSYMQKEQLQEIIDLLKKSILESIPPEYGRNKEQILGQIVDWCKFSGWLSGIRAVHKNVTISPDFIINIPPYEQNPAERTH
jgi:hypothetical protein